MFISNVIFAKIQVMKLIAFAPVILFVSCANGKEKVFIGSTPATSVVVRSFLGIPFSDSVDFIRWRITLEGDRYFLQCQFGIGKPNTDGFINEGTKIQLRGELKKEKNYYFLQNGNKALMMMELNSSLLHLLNENKGLLVGNSGWSYTLNSEEPAITDQVNIFSMQGIFKDSIAYEGRTPCNVPGVIPPGTLCYKLKWYVVLYKDDKNNSGTYKLYGTLYRKERFKTGSWKMITGKDGRIIYQLNEDNGDGLLYLLKLDDNILVFTDINGNLLVGDRNFSFTLNRIKT